MQPIIVKRNGRGAILVDLKNLTWADLMLLSYGLGKLPDVSDLAPLRERLHEELDHFNKLERSLRQPGATEMAPLTEKERMSMGDHAEVLHRAGWRTIMPSSSIDNDVMLNTWLAQQGYKLVRL